MSDQVATRDQAAALRDLELAWSSKRGIPGFLSAVNHKQIGLRFIWTSVAFLLVGGVEGLLIRLQLSQAENTFLSPEAYNQVFTMHGTTMMFLFAVPMLEGLAMYFVPLQIGTRDMPFPRLNAFGYWVYVAGGVLLHWSLITGSIPDGGWFAYTPLTGPAFSPDRGLDFWLLGVTFAEIAGIIGAIELIVTILRSRAPGMSLGRMPLFVWNVLVMASMMLIAFPFVIAASTMLELERKVGAPFYDEALGGNPLLWQHLFWIFGHPEVYIMLLPAIGVVSAVVAIHVQRPIVAYPLVVASSIAIGIVSFGLWVHHMFAVGLPAMVLGLFAVASYFIAVPSGIQVFAWIATIWDGRPRWRVPMWFVFGFLFIFVLGGITGVMVATAPFDLQAHDSFFVVAHFHYVLIGGMVFPVFGGLHHWFPKFTGRFASEAVGKVAFWLMFIGFNVTFFPQHWLGLQGMARRVYTYDADLGWEGWNLVSSVGSAVLAAGVAVFLGNLAWAWRLGRPSDGDPWHGDSLEWATSSPPGTYNFEAIPTVGSTSPLWDRSSADLDPQVAQAVLSTAQPVHGRREVIRSSAIDARPEAIVALPGPSYWPLLAAGAMAVAVVGVLVNWWVMAAAAAVATLASVVAWNLSNLGDDEPLPASRVEAHRAFVAHTPPGRDATWWAIVVTLIALGTIASAFVYSYYYLRLGADEWPLPGTDLRSLWLPLAALGAAGTAVLVSPSTRRGRLVGVLAALAATAAVVLQVVGLVESGYRPDTDAYTALVVTIDVFAALILAGAIAVRVAATIIPRPDDGSSALHDADSALFVGSIGIWIVLWAVLHVSPRVI